MSVLGLAIRLLQKRPPRHGLAVTVRLHGAVVGQELVSRAATGHSLDAGLPDAVTTDAGASLRSARWVARDEVDLEPNAPQASHARVRPGAPWRWTDGRGLAVDLDVIPERRLPRTGAPSGDLPFLILFFTLSALAAQVDYLLQRFLPNSSSGAAGAVPSPEYIARLLQNDLDGADEGRGEEVQRPDFQQEGASYYLPSGNKGPLDRERGGATKGNDSIRTEPAEKSSDERKDVAKESEPELPSPASALETDAALEEAPPTAAAPEKPDPARPKRPKVAPADPIERFIGWGFRDWMDRGAAKEMDPELERTLSVARVRLKIDPDDPYAINVVGYYAYLAEEMDLARAMYEKFVALNPEDPAGYNNLALTYKRVGEYQKEEALYRQALQIDPLDDHVLNNLAVNLAHQGRPDEALDIMKELEVLTPDDPYADLHRAKIFATMGKREKAYRYLKKALEGVATLDTLHHIEFRQDIRVDPAFAELRHEPRFQDLIRQFYGDDARQILGGHGPAPGSWGHGG